MALARALERARPAPATQASAGGVEWSPRRTVCWLSLPGCCLRPSVPGTPRSTGRNCGNSRTQPGSLADASWLMPSGRSCAHCAYTPSCGPHGGEERRCEKRAEAGGQTVAGVLPAALLAQLGLPALPWWPGSPSSS
jgi:hypothetical protein